MSHHHLPRRTKLPRWRSRTPSPHYFWVCIHLTNKPTVSYHFRSSLHKNLFLISTIIFHTLTSNPRNGLKNMGITFRTDLRRVIIPYILTYLCFQENMLLERREIIGSQVVLKWGLVPTRTRKYLKGMDWR